MSKHRTTIASLVVAVALIGGAVYWRATSGKADQPQTQATTTETKSEPKNTITPDELAANDGKDGHKCYVAVDSKVYEIQQGRLWQNGEHATSQGQAHCGKDLTEAIGKSPHGKSKLEALEVVGTLQK